MLTIKFDGIHEEFFNEKDNEFININLNETTLSLEHSLVSISKWEAKWHKSFLNTKDKTEEELRDYIRCMTITQNVNPLVYEYLDKENLNKINNYIGDPSTATTFQDRHPEGASRKSEIITSELIYYWMVAYQIPFDPCQRWHLNRLLTLIKICSIKNDNGKNSKMSKRSTLMSNRALNMQRRAALHSKG